MDSEIHIQGRLTTTCNMAT